MNKGKLWCKNCNDNGDTKLIKFEFECLEDMPKVCPECGSDDIFYQDLEYENNEYIEIKLGSGGCGGYRRQ